MSSRLLGRLLAGIMVLALASCGDAVVVAQRGAVAGRAVPCAGPMHLPTAHLAVFRGGTLVASGRFPTGSRFHFALTPGRYVITNNRASLAFGTPFVVRAGHLSRVVVLNGCE
jgi:hypothetical protein